MRVSGEKATPSIITMDIGDHSFLIRIHWWSQEIGRAPIGLEVEDAYGPRPQAGLKFK